MSTLTHKQSAFVAEYLVDMNATQAAIRAGYSKEDSAGAEFTVVIQCYGASRN